MEEKLLRKTVLLMISADFPLAMVGTLTSKSISSCKSWEMMAVTICAIDFLFLYCWLRSYYSKLTLFSRPRCFFSYSTFDRKVNLLAERVDVLGFTYSSKF